MKFQNICIAASLLACTSAFAQQPTKVLQVKHGESVIASFNLTSDLNISVVEADAEDEDYVASASKSAPLPEDDGSSNLSSTTAMAMKSLLSKMDINRALDMGETTVDPVHFAEIKKFVDENLAGADGVETYNNIFAWIRENIRYAASGETAYLDPYDVFIYKVCVCQGYANLLKTMMISQGYPAFIANGMLGTTGAHAWNYVHNGKQWIVSDPTNGNQFTMTSTSTYSQRLIPYRADLNMFEDSIFCYGFENSYLTITEVKDGAPDELTIPFGVEGYRIPQFAPRKAIPANVRSLSLGKYLRSLGQYPAMLVDYAPGLEEIVIDPTNNYLESYNGIVYQKYSSTPYFIPPSMKRVELKAMERVEKNTIYNVTGVEEIVIAEGTKIIEAYAIENCPNLRRVYVPESVTTIDKDAIYRCPSNVEIIRGGTTGIRDVRM